MKRKFKMLNLTCKILKNYIKLNMSNLFVHWKPVMMTFVYFKKKGNKYTYNYCIHLFFKTIFGAL